MYETIHGSFEKEAKTEYQELKVLPRMEKYGCGVRSSELSASICG